MEHLQKALTYLSKRDLSASRKLALQALDADHSLAVSNRVLAVAGVLLAGAKRLRHGRLDYYAVLQLARADSGDPRLVWTQFEKLASLVTPTGNGDDVPLAAEAHDLLFEAWSVLSDEEKKGRYDAEIRETFWTVCPYCYFLFEYGKVYEGCCLMCQNCRRAFHGVDIGVPSPEMVVSGKEEYYFCYGVFPLGYKKGGFNASEREKESVEVPKGDSSDWSIDLGSGDDEEGGEKFWEKAEKKAIEGAGEDGRVDGENSVKKNKFAKRRAGMMKNVKSVATKKKAKSRPESGGSDEDWGGGELVFFEGGDDLLVSLVDSP